MPIYTFECPICEKRREVSMGVYDEQDIYCKTCLYVRLDGTSKYATMQKVPSVSNFVVTGFNAKSGYSR